MKKPRPAATGLSRRTIFQRPSTHRAVNLAAGLHYNPETEGQDMNIDPSELFYIQAEDDDGVYLAHRGRRIARRHFGEPWTILEPGYRRVIAKLNSTSVWQPTRRKSRLG